ncbi:Uncharacterised protein [Shigella sonnei]|nr:Uncharacterised protein [Shigella sonnei]CSE77064.1 Uncharacterised protein [Shigella sonnei]CSE90475.1 Uncharacterised protein [Shigella sonnei]CSF17353.1 Uncharacterised protein [Shigella sonnei]CSF21052.1 Uncharacterised protein [Shigella sonnei]
MRRGGKWFFVLLIEQTFSLQLRFELFVLLLQQPFTGRLHTLNDYLVVTARLVERNIGAN